MEIKFDFVTHKISWLIKKNGVTLKNARLQKFLMESFELLSATNTQERHNNSVDSDAGVL